MGLNLSLSLSKPNLKVWPKKKKKRSVNCTFLTLIMDYIDKFKVYDVDKNGSHSQGEKYN